MRIDKKILLTIIGTNITHSEGLHWTKLPLIEIPPAHVTFENEKLIKHVAGNPWSEFVAFNSLDPAVIDSLIEFPFDEFLTIHQLREDYPLPAIYTLHKLDPNQPEKYEQTLFGVNAHGDVIVHIKATAEQVAVPVNGKDCHYSFQICNGAGLEDGAVMVAESRHLLASWMTYTESLKLFPVVKVPAPKKLGKKASYRVQVKEHNSPVVLFLGKLPTKTESGYNLPSVGSHKKSPHQRIAHYKTLTNPRYCNHPKYMVANGVRVRSAWVGTTTSIDREGATYKVV